MAIENGIFPDYELLARMEKREPESLPLHQGEESRLVCLPSAGSCKAGEACSVNEGRRSREADEERLRGVSTGKSQDKGPKGPCI